MDKFLYSFLLLIFFFSLFFSSFAKDVGDLSNGPPSFQGNILPKESYVELTTKRLKNPKVLWLNFDLLRSMGVKIPEDGLTTEFEQQILDAFAYAVPQNAHEDYWLFDSTKTKTFWADKYGGIGMNGNLGSGRAAINGRIQIKGIGRTPLVASQDFHHAHGGASILEALSEVIWGEVGHNELPFSANRVIAVIDSGTYTSWGDGGSEPRALIVRVDPLRPAQFMENQDVPATQKLTDKQRVQKAVSLIENALPKNKSKNKNKNKEMQIKDGLYEYTDRMAKQYAKAISLRIYHGATSPSNYEIHGQYLDFGTQTAQPGYGKIYVLDDDKPFGDLSELIQENIINFTNNVRHNLPKNIKIPSEKQFVDRFKNVYKDNLIKDLLDLTGIPRPVIEKLHSKPITTELAKIFKEIALTGTYIVNADRYVPRKVSSYSLNRILEILATKLEQTDTNNINYLVDSLATECSDLNLRQRLVKKYLQFYKMSFEEAKKMARIENKNFKILALKKCLQLNRDMPDLYRDKLNWDNMQNVQAYKNTGDRSILWNYLNQRIKDNKRNDPFANSPWTALLDEQEDLVKGIKIRTIWNAKNGKTYKETIKIKTPSVSMASSGPICVRDLTERFISPVD